MSDMDRHNRLSTMALNNVETLIKSYKADKNRRKYTEQFTLAFNGLIMLMNDSDKDKAIELLDTHGLLRTVKKSVRKLQKAA